MFWSSGILTGNQTIELVHQPFGEFWSSGILTGNQTTGRRSAAARSFWSSGILTGNQTATQYGSVTGLGGANCRHSFGPYRHGAPRAYSPNPKHPSGLPGEGVYKLEQKQRYLEREMRADKREMRGMELLYKANPSNGNLAAVMAARQSLHDRQAAMRELITEANAKAKHGTHVLTRNSRREWAGDMPHVQAPARTIHGNDQMRARGVTDKQAADAIINPLKKFDVVLDDKGRPSQKHVGYDATVALNPKTNEIITAYPTGARYRKKYGAD